MGTNVYGYSNSNWSGGQDDRKSTIGYLFMLRLTPISWSSNKQENMVLSSCEVEYVVAFYAA